MQFIYDLVEVRCIFVDVRYRCVRLERRVVTVCSEIHQKNISVKLSAQSELTECGEGNVYFSSSILRSKLMKLLLIKNRI